MAKNQTALSKEPKTKAKEDNNLQRVSPGIYRNSSGELVNSKGNRINRSGQRRADKADEEKKTGKENKPAPPPGPTGFKDPTAFNRQTAGQQVGNVQTEVGQNMMGYLQQLQKQGAFNPGDYQADYQQAYQNVYDQFEAQNARQFGLEAENVEEMIIQRGLDPAGRQAERLRTQMAENQGGLRRQAQLAAEQAGRAVEQQRFERELTTYNVPTQQIAALSGLFSGQVGSVEADRQRQFEGEQGRLAREQAMKIAEMQKKAGGGGGGADPFAILAAEYGYKRDLMFDEAALRGQQNKGQNPLNSAAAGFSQGFGAGLGQSLGRRG
jgi:hypothetical protein